MLEFHKVRQEIETLGSDSLGFFGGSFEGGINLQQIPDELADIICFLSTVQFSIDRYLEIGAATGGLTYVINHYFKPNTIVLIDDNKHNRHHLRSKILEDINRIEIIGNSHSHYISDCLREYTRTDSMSNIPYLFDFVVIDGDHSYEGVKQDLELIKYHLSKYHLIMLHDIHVNSDVSEVPKLRQEILESNHWLEEVFATFSKVMKPCGIGLYRIKR